MSMAWDVFAWVGIVTLTVFLLKLVYFTVETFIVGRIGWTRLDNLGFWRSIPVVLTHRGRDKQ